MGNLTNDMRRLRGEVDALRGDRGALMQDLTHGARDLTSAVAAMRTGFAFAHAAMAQKTGGERKAFVAAVIDEVNSLLSEFSRDRNDMARNGRHNREVFLAEMRKQVTGLRKETADDLMGARLVWRGESPNKSRPVPMKQQDVVVKPLSPLMEEEPKAVAAPEIEIKVENPPVAFNEPPPTEEDESTTVVAPLEAPVVETPNVEMPPPVFAAPAVPKRKEKSLLDEKPAKTATRGRRVKE